VEATLQKFSGPAALHCQSTDREERFGMAKFAERWVGTQTESDLSLLARVRDRSGDWQSVGPDDHRERRRTPDYVGPAGDRDVAEALGRALQRARLLAQVRELVSLLDRFEGVPNPALSEISNDELKKLAEARSIASLTASGGSSLDSVSPALSEHAQWLATTLAHLSVCQQVRETIGWEEITKLIDHAWLKGKGFGSSTPIDIGALKGKLISEPVPKTSGPPKPGPAAEPTISYVEARDRVGHAWFGNVFGLSLTEDERYDLEAGPWQASSAAAHRSADEKAKKIEWRRNQVDAWLADNGLIDPIRRQHGLDPLPISMKKFEAAFLPVFGEPDDLRGVLEQAYGGTLRGELERAAADQSSYAEALQILATPWSPPEGLSPDQAKRVLGDEPRPFLTNVVDLLAFGEPLPDKIQQLLGLLFRQKDHSPRTETCNAIAAEGYNVKSIAAERMRAAAALFERARRNEKPVFIGSYDRQIDQWIQPHYFDIPRNLGHEDNSISTDPTVCVDDPRWQMQYDSERENKPMHWLNVRVDGKWFFSRLGSWLKLEGKSPERTGSFAANSGAVSKAAGTRELNWLLDQMKQFPINPHKTRDALKRECCSQFGISGRQFDKIWPDACTAVRKGMPNSTWGLPGRLKKRAG
jgi:hypothetical protein